MVKVRKNKFQVTTDDRIQRVYILYHRNNNIYLEIIKKKQ